MTLKCESIFLTDKASPHLIPFLSCSLVLAAYSFLILSSSILAESTSKSPSQVPTYGNGGYAEVQALLNNVEIIANSLEAYGVTWQSIGIMAQQVRGALDAARKLPLGLKW
jgi:hypothetical protein